MLFDHLFRAMESSGRDSGLAVSSQWPDFAERMRGIYGDKIAPDSQAIISEGRGDGTNCRAVI